MRILLKVEYDGTAYAGWQRQSNGLAVQEVLEQKLSEVLHESVSVTGASRTDAGVHALGQRAHFDTQSRIPADRFPFILNTMLPPDIRITEGVQVADRFHARFLSCGKIYTYRILNRRHASALGRNQVLHVPVPLDLDRMTESVHDLVGTHDFSAFQASGGTAKSTVRTIHSCFLTRQGDLIQMTIEGNAFLYNMVRIIAGTLLDIGHGKRTEDAFRKALETGDRLSLGPTAPAHGLELTDVFYPKDALWNPEQYRWHKDPAER